MSDYISEFDLRMKKFRKWGIYMALWILVVFSGPFIILGFEGTGSFLMVYMGIASISILPALVQMFRLCRCPKCDNFIGFKVEEVCPICTIPLRNGNDNAHQS